MCKKCISAALSGPKCVKCDTVTHAGCVKYLKHAVILDSERIICCDDTINPTSADGDSEFFDAVAQQASDNKVDIRIFNYIIKQKDVLIKELYNKIDLLNQKVKYLEDSNLCTPKQFVKKTEVNKNEVVSNSFKAENKPAIIVNKYSDDSRNAVQGVTGRQVTSALLPEQSKVKMNEVIHLTDHIRHPGTNDIDKTKHTTNSDNEETWTKVERRRPRRNNVIVGNREDPNVKGVPSFTELHVYRLSKNTTVQSLTTFLKENLPEVICEQMNSKHPDLYSSFKVKIHSKNFNIAMDPKLWPSGACVNRFLSLRRKNPMTVP
nr:unnamed protein product [Callosobruchus analis]